MFNDELRGVTNTYHSITPHDLVIISSMKEQFSTLRGEVEGPQARASFDQVMESIKSARKVCYREETINGVKGWWCIPSNIIESRAILYFHGGAYNIGSSWAYRNFAGNIAERANTSLFIPDYRLAPENPYPAAVEDAQSAYIGLVNKGFKSISIMGDSAGGGLALVTMAKVAFQDDLLNPASCAVFSPWTDLKLESSTMQSKAENDILLAKASLVREAARYLNGATPSDPNVSPLYGSLSSLPPIQIHVGEAEILLGDSLRYTEKAIRNHTRVDLHIWEGMPHVFPSNIGKLDAAEKALTITASFMQWQE
ncbi:MAG: alpha/beta hydrolase [Sphingobacterium sp.]